MQYMDAVKGGHMTGRYFGCFPLSSGAFRFLNNHPTLIKPRHGQMF